MAKELEGFVARLTALRGGSGCSLKHVAINAIRGSQINRCVILLRAIEERAHGQTTSNGIA